MAYVYGLSEGVVLRVDPTRVPETLTAWISGEWRAYPTIDKDWIEGMRITEAVAKAMIKSNDDVSVDDD